MATPAKPRDDQQTTTMNVLAPGQQQTQRATTANQPINISGAQSANVGANAAPAQKTGPASSGLFTNIRSFFDANKQAGQKIAGTVTEKATEQAQTTGQAIQEKQQEYAQQAQQAQQAIQQSQQAGTGIVQNVMGGQTNLTPEQISQYQALAQGKDVSGQTVGDVANLNIDEQQKIANTLGTQAEQARTARGSFDLLRSYFSTPQKQYTSGLQALDTAFLRSDDAAKQQLTSSLKDISTDVLGKAGEAQQFGAETAAEIQARRQAMQEALTGERTSAQTGIQSEIDARAQQLYGDRENIVASIRAAEEAGDLGQLDRTMLDALGLSEVADAAAFDPNSLLSKKYWTDADWNQYLKWAEAQSILKGISGFGGGASMTPGAYVKGAVQQYTPEQLRSFVAQQEEFAKIQALSQLAGEDQSFIFDPSKVGQGLEGSLAGMKHNTAAAKAEFKRTQDAFNQALLAQTNPSGAWSMGTNWMSILNDMWAGGASKQQGYDMIVEKARAEGIASPNDSYDAALNKAVSAYLTNDHGISSVVGRQREKLNLAQALYNRIMGQFDTRFMLNPSAASQAKQFAIFDPNKR